MTLDWLNIAALLGAAQGFFLAGVLATQRRNRTANRLLAVAVFAFSIQMITVVYHAVELEQVFPHFFGVAFPLPLIYGPLIYLYTLLRYGALRTEKFNDLTPPMYASIGLGLAF